MRVPCEWLREYVPAMPDDIDEVADVLTMTGTKVEALHEFGVPGGDNGAAAGYRVGRVVEFEQHPNADRLRLCRIDVGEGEPRQIVCGASNFEQGDRVAVVLPGATLPGGERLGKAKLRGIESFGMMLSERELDLSTDHAGIMILPPEWEIGSSLGEHWPLGDRVLELEITPNRPDCLGVYGVAREVSAAFDTDLVDALAGDAAATAQGSVEDHVSVELAAPDLCRRYMARAFVDVLVGPSPHWLKARLAAAGMRAINNVVDVTNYVMLMVGQPLHAFDADRLRGGRIVVRRAADGEQVTTLDGIERTLDPSMLAIADGEGTAVIAGVMGAADVEVGEQTTRVVLEAACFDGPTINRTSTRLGLRSESSARFEKGLDPHLPEVALRVASRMLVELCGAKMVPGTIDAVADGAPGAAPQVLLERELCSQVLGFDVPGEVVERVLGRLGYSVEPAGAEVAAGWKVGVPHFRMFDTTRPIDLVEEVGRIHGLEHIPSSMPARRSAVGALTRGQRLQRLLEDAAAGLGLREAITYSLVAAGDGDALEGREVGALRLSNPMTSEHVELRTSLLTSLLDVVRHNRAVGIEDVALFEMARTFGQVGASLEGGGLPRFANERRVLALACAGTLFGGRMGEAGIGADFAAATGIVRSLLATAGVDAWFSAFDGLQAPPAFLHPGQSANVVVDDGDAGAWVGWVGTVHPSLVRERDIRGDVVAAELDLGLLEEALPGVRAFQPFSEFPPVRQDIALVLDAKVVAADVLRTVREAAGGLLEDVAVFDRYEGESIGSGRYSLALRLTFRALDRTLTEDEVSRVRGEVAVALADAHGARLRDG